MTNSTKFFLAAGVFVGIGLYLFLTNKKESNDGFQIGKSPNEDSSIKQFLSIVDLINEIKEKSQ